MNSATITPETTFTPAQQINRLHAVAVRFAIDSQNSLRLALSAAWQAGQLLLAEKKRVRQSMGHRAWLHWLEENFDGSACTAQRTCASRSRSPTSAPAFHVVEIAEETGNYGSQEPRHAFHFLSDALLSRTTAQCLVKKN